MPITAGICDSYKQDILQGIHLSADTYKIALYTSSATINNTTATYAGTNEVAAGSGYTLGGATLSGYTVSGTGGVAFADFTTDPVWPTANITARGALIYNFSRSNKAVCVLDFGGDITSTNANFSVAFPAAAAATALLRIS